MTWNAARSNAQHVEKDSTPQKHVAMWKEKPSGTDQLAEEAQVAQAAGEQSVVLKAPRGGTDPNDNPNDAKNPRLTTASIGYQVE